MFTGGSRISDIPIQVNNLQLGIHSLALYTATFLRFKNSATSSMFEFTYCKTHSSCACNKGTQARFGELLSDFAPSSECAHKSLWSWRNECYFCVYQAPNVLGLKSLNRYPFCDDCGKHYELPNSKSLWCKVGSHSLGCQSITNASQIRCTFH